MQAKIIIPNQTTYLIIDPSFRILDFSPRVQEFLLNDQIQNNDDVRDYLNELVGLEDVLLQLQSQELSEFSIQEVDYTTNNPDRDIRYLTLRLESKSHQEIFIFIEDVTETAILRQSLVQRVNETELLLNALKTASEYNSRIITSMQEALLITNKTHFIKTINTAACELFGYDETFLLNCTIRDLFWNQDCANAHFQKLSQQPDEAITLEADFRTRLGHRITVEFSVTIVRSQSEQTPTFVYVGRDVTARNQLEMERERALIKEKELNDLKSRFLTMTSHEFKNPLSTILMSVELLEEFGSSWQTQQQEKYLSRIKQCTKNMNDLLEDILLIGRADISKLVFNPSRLDLLQFCREILDEFKPLCAAKHQLQLRDSLGEDQYYIIDAKLLRHVLSNLLSNAIKYSPNGGEIQLIIRHQNQHLIFQVRDQGIGIPREDQSRLFEYFHRSRNVSDIAGTGLGLSIAKRAVELQQGTITFTTKINQGTCFTVKIPIVNAEFLPPA